LGVGFPLHARITRSPFYHRHEGEVMRHFAQHLVSFLRNEDGPTAVEYTVMLALVIVVCLLTISVLGNNTNNTFSYSSNKVGKVGS
jgi:pilus assembly protein Flp/PilA